MVFFTCNSCGEALKKNKVDKHLSQCRSKSVSCVDCGRDFTHDYNSHNQCVSEDQKYGGLDYKPKENSSKGKTKQEEWVQKVKTAINESNCSNHIKELLERLSGYDNIPRKKQKFFNFVRSCLHVSNQYYAQQMWSIFETTIKSTPQTDPDNSQKSDKHEDQNGISNGTKRQSNDSNDINESKKKRQKIKVENQANEEHIPNNSEANGSHEVTEDSQTETTPTPKLKIRKIVVQILNESQNNRLSIKKLKKRVIKRLRLMDDSLSKDYITSKFFSKLYTIKKIETNEGMVSLKEV